MAREHQLNRYFATQLVAGLASHGWAPVQVALTPENGIAAMTAFHEFLEGVDENRRLGWLLHLDHDNQYSSGFVRREGRAKTAEELAERPTQPRHEAKVYVHWIAESAEHAETTIGAWPEREQALARTFFRHAEMFRIASNNAWLNVFEALDTIFPGLADIVLPQGRKPRTTMRFLRYESAIDDLLAQDHCDAGEAALAIASNCAGLVGRNPLFGDMQPISPQQTARNATTAAFLPARKLQDHVHAEHPHRRFLAPLEHGVRHIPGATPTVGSKRMAVISFLDKYRGA